MRFFAPFSANIDGISRHNLLKRIQTKSTLSLNAVSSVRPARAVAMLPRGRVRF